MEATFPAEVVQFVFPTGARQERTTKLPIEAKSLYDEMRAAGCHFEAEVLSSSEVSTTISNGVEDIAIRVTENGPTVQRGMVDMLIGKPWAEK
jgi:hypothetical protein